MCLEMEAKCKLWSKLKKSHILEDISLRSSPLILLDRSHVTRDIVHFTKGRSPAAPQPTKPLLRGRHIPYHPSRYRQCSEHVPKHYES